MKIEPFWCNYYKTLNYSEEYFRDNKQLAKWKSAGHNIDCTTIHICPIKKDNNILIEVERHFKNLSNIGVCFHRLSPGHYLPTHQDRYGFYSKQYNIENLDKIKRFVIFAEDWKDGHFLTIGNKVYSNWKAGDVASWNGTVPHSAINLGNNFRYTIQVTGLDNAI